MLKRQIKISIYVVLLFFLKIGFSTLKSSNGHTYLSRDYAQLFAVGHDIPFSIGEDEFLNMFDQGLKESHAMLITELSNQRFGKHRRKLKKLNLALKVAGFKHPIFPKNRIPKMASNRRVRKSHFGVFADFRGRWYGKWKDFNVAQHWLAPRYLESHLRLGEQKIHLKAFQTVNIGDGIGWNYTVQIDKKLYLIGYTFHFDESNVAYLKRPHIGFSLGDNALAWVTEDHVYFEHICKSEKCRKKPLHYSITGASFCPSGDVPQSLFQTIYTVDRQELFAFQEKVLN